ncbi:DsbA family oxidoreductase [Novosphingobium sp.]|uniref:DsbA family oxidoreductase n=1 Tax=Novosphingobium sp. TaxID=1874826 RepID=UPI0025D0C98C|nr:DsbA family oxidoreductase [Novosphingobium sp.]MCC6924942.1 DsbA family oxidoreductase [Novosphingobium sp.]
MPAKVSIDIYSDVMCPWCIIGYSQLQKGLAQLDGEIEAEVRWLPFELNPDMPAEGEGQSEHIARKYGRTVHEAETNRQRLIEIGDRAGYSFAWTGTGEPPKAMIWNTFAAHKLLKWALIEHGAEVQNRLKLALFDAHFQQRRNVSDPEVLTDVAASLGLDPAAARAALDDEALGLIVRREQSQAWDMNISGVPAMVVNGQFLIPGAQEPEVYAQALRRVVAKGITPPAQA